jgi:hypothetical protein
MAVSIAAMSQRFNAMPELYGTATGYSESVTATGALDVAIPVSIITILGTATTVGDTYTLGTAPYEGFEKTVITAQSATDGVGLAHVELANAVGDPAQQVVALEYPGTFSAKWLNDRWIATAGLGGAVSISTATV